jgi:hypothetical protein
MLHLSEIKRVLHNDGICYMAMPNKSSPFMAGHKGNKQVLRYRAMQPLFKKMGFIVNAYYARLIHHPKQFHFEVSFGRFIPLFFLNRLNILFPSQCFILTPASQR